MPETDAYRGVADDDALVRLVDELSTEHGLEFITTRRLLCLLAGTRPTDVASLVRGTGAGRRRFEEVLARLTDHLDDTADGYRVRPSAVPTLRRLALRFGWWLQGYPAAIYTPHIQLDVVPSWRRIYRLGVRICQWSDR